MEGILISQSDAESIVNYLQNSLSFDDIEKWANGSIEINKNGASPYLHNPLIQANSEGAVFAYNNILNFIKNLKDGNKV